MYRKEENLLKPHRNIFFFNNELVRLIHVNRSQNLATIFIFSNQKRKQVLFSDFKKMRRRAYSFATTCRILKRTKIQMYRYIESGLIHPPVGTLPQNERKYGYASYYSEDDIYKIRDAMATIHRGRPRKDGLITSTAISEQELRYRLEDGIMLYTQTSDGRYVPVWNETL